MKYQCKDACANPSLGYFAVGDIVEDEAVIAGLEKDGQLIHFTSGKPQPQPEAKAEAAPRAAVLQKKKG